MALSANPGKAAAPQARGTQLADYADFRPHAHAKLIAKRVFLGGVLIMRHSDRIAAHVAHYCVIPFALFVGHSPASARRVLMIIHAVQWSVFRSGRTLSRGQAELPHSELLRNAVQGSSAGKYGYLR